MQLRLPQYLEEVARGETIEVIQNEQTVAELRATPRAVQTPRPIGLARGTFQVPPSFFEPLPDDVLDAFSGETE
jgi:antitoxin (DNA-binding transcriptional repressor) of toxin-antitoxin stability system